MLINNVDIKSFDAMLLSKDIQTAEVITYQDWLRKSFDPQIYSQEANYTSIKIKLLIEGDSEDDVLIKISNIVNIAKESVIKFDDISWFFNCTIDKSNNVKIINTAYELEISFKSAFKYTNEIIEVANRVSSKVITTYGNQKVPCILEIVPTIDIIDIKLEGFADDPIIIKNLKAGKTVIVDGETQKVTQDGINKYADTDMWDFPYLEVGVNNLKFSKNICDIKVKYKPRYL